MAIEMKVTPAKENKVATTSNKVVEEKVVVKAAAPKKTTEVKTVAVKSNAKTSGKPKTAAGKHQKAKKPLAGKTVTIQQVSSGAGRLKSQIETLKGLSLNKINKVSELEDTPSIRGMINKVKHLIKVLTK